MPPVPVPRRRQPPPATPEELYDRLQVTDPDVEELWRRQSHALGQYHAEHRHAADVALEMPTGGGKTLVGLLIADWRRQVTDAPSAFLCPTNQLAHQAWKKAIGYGIPAVLLVGSNADWPAADRAKGLSGASTIISNYNHIFNTSPKMSPQTLVFDDAHAAEGIVADNWSVMVPRSHGAYRPLLRALLDVLPTTEAGTLTREDVQPLDRPLPVLVGPHDLGEREAKVLAALDEHRQDRDSIGYPLSQLRGHLGGCMAYLSWEELLIRPFIPPTSSHAAFADAGQRVYMSATLGAAGELERAFGRRSIKRVGVPPEWERNGSNGRRLVLLPGAGLPADEAVELTKRTVGALPRTLTLVPSARRMADMSLFLPDGLTRLGFDDVDDDLEPFRSMQGAILTLANRYDGIDLPGDACQLILMVGLPTGTHLQERFLDGTVGARSALRERIRTRITQGMGRATRSRSDRAVVILASTDLLDFLSESANVSGMRAEIQAELRYGLFLAEQAKSRDDITAVVDGFLAAGEDWADAEEYLREQIDEASNEPPDGAVELEESAPSEVLACFAAWRGDYGDAAGHAQAAVRHLAAGSVSAYRTVWKTLGAHWAAQHAAQTADVFDHRVAAELARDAHDAARPLSWLPPLPRLGPPPPASCGPRAIRVADRLLPLARSRRVDRHIAELVRWVGDDEAEAFELGLERLGEMLGFEAVRSRRKAAPDGAWRDGDWHVLWEAKTEQLSGGAISARIARQAGTHHTWAERELDWPAPDGLVTFLVSPRASVEPEVPAVADEHVMLCRPEHVRVLADQVADLWTDLVARAASLQPMEAALRAQSMLDERGLATGQLPERLQARRLVDIRA